MRKNKDRLLSGRQKFWMKMKLYLVLMIGSSFSLSAEMYAQQQRIDLKMKEVSVKTLLDEIQRQTDLYFVFNTEQTNSLGKLSVDVKNETVENVLKQVFENSNLMFHMEGNVVVVRMKNANDKKMKTLRGTVRDVKKQPIYGVNVLIKGTTLGTTTDKDGKYVLSVPNVDQNTVIVYMCLGMKLQEIKYADKDTIDVVLEEDMEQLEAVVVNTGYEKIDPRKSTSAIQSIKAEDIVVAGLTSIDQMLEGHVPGMIFMANSGQVGATPRLRIRGTSTVLGNQEPLWVIDGIVQENPVDVDPSQINDLDFVNLLGNAITGLNPDDIEQIDILKDASATALYGAQAANGVIVITTKKGKAGPPTISYNFNATYSNRPRYSDRSIYMMNSRERVAFSRELIEKHVTYPKLNTEWVGYEKYMYEYLLGQISFEEMQEQVGYYESVNTDWFDLVMQNTFSHKHTLSFSGGSNQIRYYASVGLNNTPGQVRGENYNQYTGNLSVSGSFDRFTINFKLGGNISDKEYMPTDIKAPEYAYRTTRALPLYNEDGSYFYYMRYVNSRDWRPFNIKNEMENSSYDVRGNGFNTSLQLDYRLTDNLRASLTGSYSTDNTTQETWHGEDSFYVLALRASDLNAKDQNACPVGGELKYQHTERKSYMARGQLNYNQYLDEDQVHHVTTSVGGELSSNRYNGNARTYRGYLKERGKVMAALDYADHPYFVEWQSTAPEALGTWTDKLTNKVSAYATASYTYNDNYTFNANMRLDASNTFGSRANEKLAPIWSLSGRWDVKNTVLQEANWLSSLTLRTSFGYQGNMLDTQSAELVIERGGYDSDYQEFESTIKSYPNPDLKWEKTASYNVTVDFALLKNRITGSASYFYKHTKDAFLTKDISTVNGVSSWVVNQGDLENKGLELSLMFKVIDTRRHNPENGVSWTLSPNLGQILNKLTGGKKDGTLANNITYTAMLSGDANITGRALNSFYSYKFLGLNPNNGVPEFYGSNKEQYIGNEKVNLLEKYQNMELVDIFTDAMEYSGCRVPTLQGGISNSFAWRNFSASINLTYSFGSHIRLFKLYPNVYSGYGTIAPQPLENVRKEFTKRWQKPGDEMKTTIPGIVSGQEFSQSLSHWSGSYYNMNDESIRFATTAWHSYDNSNLRTVSGNFVKIQSMSIRYNIPTSLCKQMGIKSAYLGVSGTNLHTFCSSKLRGQDPATQDGIAPTITQSLRPTYSFNLSVSF